MHIRSRVTRLFATLTVVASLVLGGAVVTDGFGSSLGRSMGASANESLAQEMEHGSPRRFGAYMKLLDIEGESIYKSHKGQIDIL